MGLNADEIVIIVVTVLTALYAFFPTFIYIAFFKKNKEYAYTSLKNRIMLDPNTYMAAVVWGKQKYTLYIHKVDDKFGSKYLMPENQDEQHLPNIMSMHDHSSRFFEDEL